MNDLSEVERHFEATFDRAAVGIAHAAPDGSWLRVNQKVCDIVGYSRDELLTKTFQDITHPDDLDADLEQVRRMLAGEIETYTMEKRYIRKDGSIVWIHLTVSLVSKPDGSPDFFVSVIEDIQQRKETEQALRDSELRWKRLVENVPDILYQYSTKHGGLYYSPQVEAVFGLPPDDLLAHPMHWPNSIHPEDRPIVQHAIEGLQQGVPFAIEYRVKDRQGNWHWLYDRSIGHHIADDELVIEGLAMDITNHKKRDESLVQAEAMFRELTNGIPGAIFQYILHPDGTGSVVHMSDGSLGLWEIAAEDAMKDPSSLWNMVLPEDADGLSQSIKDSAASMRFWTHEWRIRTPSGKLKWLSGSGTPKRLENNDIFWNSVIIDVTQERHSEKALDSFFEQQINLNAIVDLDGTFLRVNRLWESVLGYGRKELEGRKFIEFVHPDDRQATLVEAAKVVDQGESSLKFENRYRHKNGHYRLFSWSSKVSFDEGLIYAIANDITEAREAEKKIVQAATVFGSTAEGVMITDLDTNILEVNDAFSLITGYRKDEVIGKSTDILQSGRHDRTFYQAMWQSIEETGNWRGEVWNRRKDGGVYPELLTISTIWDEDGNPTGYVGVFSDISSLKEHQERLDYLAHHDPLTNLPNRLLFNSRLQQSIVHAKRQRASLAVAFIDLDRFKHVNDSMGHAVGDSLLVQIAERLRDTLRSADTVARMSGDEFVVLLEDIDGPENAALVADKLLETFERPFQVDGVEISMSASMGLSLCPQDTDDASTLLANADAAMYQAKEEGRNTYLFYSSEFTTQAFEYVFLENALQKALDEDEFYVVYQPQVDLQNNRIVGMEALLRWEHPDRGLISPARFIPIAEQSGLIRKIGRWVLESTCAQGNAWLRAGLPIGRIAVNVAGPQFHQDSFVEEVGSILDKTGFPAEHLALEVTESFVMRQTDNTIPKLEALRTMGIEVAIDDFGTGYSSLSYLKKLPMDKLKVDQSFVRDIPHDHDDIAIAEAIIGLGEALNLRVIAEGIETEDQVDFFRRFPCRIEGQGYLFSKPLKADKLERLLRDANTAQEPALSGK